MKKPFKTEVEEQLKIDKEFQALFKSNPMLYWASQEIFDNQRQRQFEICDQNLFERKVNLNAFRKHHADKKKFDGLAEWEQRMIIKQKEANVRALLKQDLRQKMSKDEDAGQSFDYMKRLRNDTAKDDVKMRARLPEFLKSVTKRESGKLKAPQSQSLKFHDRKKNPLTAMEDGFLRLRRMADLARMKQEL